MSTTDSQIAANDIAYEQFRQKIWIEMYVVRSASIYFEKVLSRHKIWNWCFRSLTALLAGSAEFINFLDVSFAYKAISFLPFFGLSFSEVKLNFIKIEPLRNIRKGCMTLSSMLDQLWEDAHIEETDESLIKFRARLSQILQFRDVLLHSRYIEEDLTLNEKLNDKCTEKAKMTMINLYEGTYV